LSKTAAFHVGIDLGTTNSAVAYVPRADAEDADFPPIQVLDIPQPVAPGRTEARRTLPSFLFSDGPDFLTGTLAREQGALVPTKSIYAAKSWLSNAQVDRTARILPWDAQEAGRLLSPVDASARYLAFLRGAWDARHPRTPLSEQSVVLTVPASFDEEARALTVQAARDAGLDNLTLLEEPAAAFYSWIANHLAQSQKNLQDGMHVLVVDVGGGTSDFTLIRVNREGDRVQFTRTAVGQHLLLGGDNLDLTLAWLAESKLGAKLSLRQRSGLRRSCSSAKERLLSEGGPDQVEITVLGGGSSLIGGTLKTSITREEATELALDGFLPFCELADRPEQDARSLFREAGLPYESDASITKHLAAFLAQAGDVRPDALLFNGGFFIPPMLRQRVADVLERWYSHPPLILDNQDLDLAVAVGAAYYSNVRQTGQGVLVRGGLPRAYYIGLDQDRLICLVPRGAEEGSTLTLEQEGLQLIANKPVRFRLFSSLTRTEDPAGALLEAEPGMHEHAPLEAVIRFGKPNEERQVPVRLVAHLTAIGTLELFAESRISEHRWKLEFQLRKAAAAATGGAVQKVRPAASISDAALAAGEALLDTCFAPSGFPPEELPSKLEQTLSLGRASWPLTALRRLADRFLALSEQRKLSAAHEFRWLNLAGFCLRPGFGAPGDDLRIEQARRVYAAGLAFPNQVQNEIEWWIFWGRAAGGLNKNQQADIYQRISGYLLPKGAKRPPRMNTSLEREMWRTASSLELLPIGTKTELAELLIAKARKKEASQSDFWCLARLGARQLFHGPANLVIPASTVDRWIPALLPLPDAAETLAHCARITGDAARDLNSASLDTVRGALAKHPKAEQLLALLEGEDAGDLAALGRIYGEELPSGLILG
jgi:molecular chaperone DnaK (HSP70)